MQDSEALRIDKLLWYLRLAKSRTLAQNWIEAGYMRVNGKRVMHSHLLINIADVITLPRGDDVLAIRIVRIPHRRGPAPEAQKCYSFLSTGKNE
jgi:ribosome-associated heat shock protein Hsp15